MIKSLFIFFVAFFYFLTIRSYGQQDVLYSQYMFNSLAINPAFAGSQSKTTASLFFKKQYSGISNSPIFQNILINSPIKNQKIGLGLQVINQNSNWYNFLEINALYSYRILLNQGVFAMGIGAGVQQQMININAEDYKHENDDLITGLKRASYMPNMQIGAYYQKKNWYLGVSVRHLLSPYYSSKTEYFAPKALNYYFQFGIKNQLSDDFYIVSNVLAKYATNFSPQLDITNHLLYKNVVWIGASYRTIAAFSFQAGFHLDKIIPRLNQSMRIGYAYDWYPQFSTSTASHEIMLIIDWERHLSPNAIRKQKTQISPFFQ